MYPGTGLRITYSNDNIDTIYTQRAFVSSKQNSNGEQVKPGYEGAEWRVCRLLPVIGGGNLLLCTKLCGWIFRCDLL